MKATLNGNEYTFDGDMTILEAARSTGVHIPTLCHNEFLEPYGGCRLCLVEVEGKRGLVPACTTMLEEAMTIRTESDKITKSRRFVVELLLSRCPDAVAVQKLARSFDIPFDDERALDPVGRYLLYRAPKREKTNCILCNLCVRVCAQIPKRFALSFEGRGIERRVRPPFEKPAETCIGCGSCAYVCPTKTITVEEVS